jgi:citrate/tricarballylate utilization protein
MPVTEALLDAGRMMQVCNACRYCEGFCAVFPAMERRREFAPADLHLLANLCHNCRACLYACQYAPPHEFGVNVPRAFAALRGETYAEYAWPRFLARLYRRNGLAVSMVTAISVTLVLILAALLNAPGRLLSIHEGPGAFYALIPAPVMVAVAGGSFCFSLLALAVGAARFWRAGGGGVPRLRSLLAGLRDALTLRNLGGGGDGCNDTDGRFSQARRRSHHALFYGFMLCFASTCVAAVYEHVLGLVAPYPLLSLPVVLGTVGGVGMVIGAIGLAWLKVRGDPEAAAPGAAAGEYGLIFLLGMTALTGLLLLALRTTPAMGVLLAVHLGFVLAFFLLMPYGKFVHGVYRAVALVRNATERAE